jgi:AcrR family transcriptional regulator
MSDTRSRVLEAAAELIDERGFAEVSIGDLTAASGVSNGSIYHHFGAKDGVLAALVVGALAGYQQRLLALLDEHADDARGGIVASVGFHLAWMEGHPREARLIAAHRDAVARGPHGAALTDANRSFLRAVRAWVTAQAAAGEMPAISIDLLHAIVFAPAQELAGLWLAGRVTARPTSFSPTLGAAAWAGVVAADPDEEPSR